MDRKGYLGNQKNPKIEEIIPKIEAFSSTIE
jgi:hypothetical protein